MLPINATSQTINGVTFTVKEDGAIVANGTATNNINYIIAQHLTMELGTFTLSGCPAGGSVSTYYLGLVLLGSYTFYVDTGNGQTKTYTNFDYDNTNTTYRIFVANGVVCNNLTFKPMFEKSSTASDYTPHAEQNAPLTLGNIELYEGDEIEIDYVQKAGYKKVTGARFVKNNAKIASYNGETITTEYKSTTGQLTTGATVVYKLATPVTTPITDPTLLAQFETLINMKTYKEVTNIELTGEDLAPVLDCDYYQDMSTIKSRIFSYDSATQTLTITI